MVVLKLLFLVVVQPDICYKQKKNYVRFSLVSKEGAVLVQSCVSLKNWCSKIVDTGFVFILIGHHFVCSE